MAPESIKIREENGKPIRFVHAAEAEVAAILDHYGIDWEYEKRTFVLARDETGAVVRAFCPDFYLPEHDLYIEITTQKQKLITKKHRKISDAREMYGISVVLLNKSGVELMRKVFSKVLDERLGMCYSSSGDDEDAIHSVA